MNLVLSASCRWLLQRDSPGASRKFSNFRFFLYRWVSSKFSIVIRRTEHVFFIFIGGSLTTWLNNGETGNKADLSPFSYPTGPFHPHPTIPFLSSLPNGRHDSRQCTFPMGLDDFSELMTLRPHGFHSPLTFPLRTPRAEPGRSISGKPGAAVASTNTFYIHMRVIELSFP